MGFRKCRKFARITQLVCEEARIQVNDWLSEFYGGKAKKTVGDEGAWSVLRGPSR